MVFFLGDVCAFEFPIFKVSHRHYPYAEIDVSGDEPRFDDLEILIRNWNAELQMLAPIQKGVSSVSFGLGYETEEFIYKQPLGNTGIELPDFVQAVSLRIGYSHKLNDKWTIRGFFAPALVGDLEDIQGDDWKLTTLLIASWKLRPNMSLSFGGIYTGDLGRPMGFPTIGFSYEKDWFSLSLRPPRSLEIMFQVAPRVKLGIAGRLQGNKYHLTTEPMPRAEYIEFSIGTADFVFEAGLWKGWYLNAEVGYTWRREFEFVDGNEDPVREFTFENTVTVLVGLAYRLKFGR